MSMIYKAAVASTLVALAAPAVAANPEDGALNGVYERLTRARAAGDVPGMTGAFAPEGLLVDARPGPAIAGGELADRLAPQAARITADGVRIETAYRIERRSVSGDIALDAGYMRQSISRPNAEPMIRYARFLTTMRRGADGAWRIIGDASMPSTQEVWSGLARVDGLQFDG